MLFKKTWLRTSASRIVCVPSADMCARDEKSLKSRCVECLVSFGRTHEGRYGEQTYETSSNSVTVLTRSLPSGSTRLNSPVRSSNEISNGVNSGLGAPNASNSSPLLSHAYSCGS